MTSRLDNLILSTAYFPPIDYFVAIAASKRVLIENNDSYIKQTYRNRCRIYATDGALSLSIPIRKEHDSSCIKEVKIDYFTPWLQQHKRAIISSYGSSPFFEYYKDDIFEILDSKEESLLALNTQLLFKILELIGIEREIIPTSEYFKQYPQDTDLRDAIHPKHQSNVYELLGKKIKPYYQVFSDKLGFMSDLSILDLLFNEGPESSSFLL